MTTQTEMSTQTESPPPAPGEADVVAEVAAVCDDHAEETKTTEEKQNDKVSAERSTNQPKESINPVSEASEYRAAVNAPLVNNDAQAEVEGLLRNVTVAQLEAEFAKSGPIKQKGLQVRDSKAPATMFTVTLPPAHMDAKVCLPVDLIEPILSISPVNTVLRFKSLSKQWHAIISDPRFVRIHRIQRSKLSKNQNMFLAWKRPEPERHWQQRPDKRVCLMKLEDGKLTTVTELDDRYQPRLTSFTPLCSCNGIFLLTNNGSFLLWNPSIRKSTKITVPSQYRSRYEQGHPSITRDILILNAPDCLALQHNMYYDAASEDYKIVFVFTNYYTVYSCKNKCWGNKVKLPCCISLILDGAFVDGCFYCVSRNGEIVFFHVEDGKLDKFRQPNHEGLQLVHIEAIAGRLCLSYNKTSGKRSQIWVMERNENSKRCWRKLNNEDADVMWWFENESNLSIYNCGEMKKQKIELNWNGKPDFFQYQENLYIPA